MVSAERQQVIETNRSLRNIKNELEALLDKNVLSESAFDAILALLPAEGTLGHSSTAATTPLPTPIPQASHAPPSYAQSTGPSGPPPLPGRKEPPPAPPAKPVLANCLALYKYDAADARDVSFAKGDKISVYEKMNADWWLGRNETTGQEGIFPRAYVEEQHNEKGGYPPPPGPQQNPYNGSVPPMGIAGGYNGQQPQGEDGQPSKTETNTKKFGKKLGNAAIFGAGATIGSNIVNSIF
ncbi:SH3 domain-containing protein [Podospora conica]|nr:SH3 domain-containing protein [Schizothecium conicum]